MVLISKSYFDELISIKEKQKNNPDIESKSENLKCDEQKGSGQCESPKRDCESPPTIDQKPCVPKYQESTFDHLFLEKTKFLEKIPQKFVKRHQKKAIIIAESIYSSPDFKVLEDGSFQYKNNHISKGNIFNLIKSFLYGGIRLQIGQKEFMQFLREENLLSLRKPILNAFIKKNKKQQLVKGELEKLEVLPQKWYCLE